MRNSFSHKRTHLVACLFLLGLALALTSLFQTKSAAKEKSSPGFPASRFEVKVVPVGPSETQLETLRKSLPYQPAVAALLDGAQSRYLYTELIEPDIKGEIRRIESSRFRAFFYDYSHQWTVVAEGFLSGAANVTAHVERSGQPLASREEFQDAVELLMQDRVWGPAINSRNVATYHPMPPILQSSRDKVEGGRRIILVGLMPSEDGNGFANEIVGVDLAAKTVLRYPAGAPRQSSVSGSACGAADANQATTSRGTAGQYQLTVTDTGTTLWEVLVIRPSVSSGTRGSGIELRDVKYKGISVLKRAHVPILNIKYVDGACGPYRDWQYEEGYFQATGTAIPNAPGFIDCGTTPATTSLESGNDTGNFKGVALYRQGSEVVLVSELEAGWYRYISEWRFDADGTIRPRFGFGAIVNACTCQTHDHHAFYRFDFDVGGTVNSIYELPNKSKPTSSSQPNFLHPTGLISTEKKIFRAGSLMHRYRIRGGDRSYMLVPGQNDGEADAYARGDMWFLHYKTGQTNLQAEIDDGANPVGTTGTEANLDQFLTNESLVNQDSVIWYHASFHHAPDASIDSIPRSSQKPLVLSGDHVVGPDLFPENW
jgi:hypothetical protein